MRGRYRVVESAWNPRLKKLIGDRISQLSATRLVTDIETEISLTFVDQQIVTEFDVFAKKLFFHSTHGTGLKYKHSVYEDIPRQPITTILL